MVSRKWLQLCVASLLVLVGLSPISGVTLASTTSELELQTDLQNYFAGKHAKYTLSLRELGGAGHQVGIDDTRHIDPASVIKLFWAWAALKKVDAGQIELSAQLKPGFTWDKCLNLMIQISSNECAVWIREALGNNTLNSLLIAEGYPDTQIVLDSAGKYKTKYTSAADTSLLLERLQLGALLSPESTQYFHNLLRKQVFRGRITAGVQKGVVVENKGGNLWVTDGWTNSDAAIVYGPNSTYVLVIYGREDAKNSEIAAASKIVYEHIQGQQITVLNTFARRQYRTVGNVWVRRTPGGRAIYKAKANTLVELYYSEKDWVKIKQNGKTAGFVRFSALALRSSYVWP